jgi:tetratricopeptide (TPR) repeat protein
VSDDNDSQIVPKGPQGLLKTSSSLVRRGLKDLSKRHSGSLAADQWFEKGYDSWGEYDHADAVACFDKAIEVYPAHVNAWYYKGWSLEILGRLTDSIESFDRCLEIDPSHPRALRGKGHVLAKLGRFEEALDCYDAADRLEQAGFYALSEKGEVLHELGRYDDAIHCYNESLREYENAGLPYDDNLRDDNFVGNVLSHKADALLKLHRFEEAVLCYDESLSHLSFDVLSPDSLFSVFLSIFLSKRGALVELGRNEEALHCFDAANQTSELRNKAALYKAGEFSYKAYCGAVRKYQTMIKEHVQKSGQLGHE